MRKTEDRRVNSGDSSDDNTYVNLQDFKAQKIENHPNHEGAPAAKNTHNKMILILMVFLILMFLILAVLTSLLFIKYITITEELSQMKNNATSVDRCTLELQRDVESLKTQTTSVDRRTLELQRDVESVKTQRPSCENGWLEFEDHCYFFSNFELNWTNAEKMCLNRESHLVIVNNEAEQEDEQHWPLHS
ncbi:oxidized low-density lipoprotein receptor 1-like isoform X2 [Rana temporaria]|uniref:oxidized low-density lipoprotein receptor 1-like isoform X2 n=1 Tax=Rana temporaria TaxID=8407 RepID=UPI001AACEFFB|nr:oxidized low-density lipoprotein receptor 1-like isoform X2 [Rana temporaria]